MLESILIFMLVLVAIMLIGIILVQSGQGDMGAAMGGNTMNQAFGSEGADKLLVRITTTLAAIFMVLAISINLLEKDSTDTGSTNYEGVSTTSEENNGSADGASASAESNGDNAATPPSEQGSGSSDTTE